MGLQLDLLENDLVKLLLEKQDKIERDYHNFRKAAFAKIGELSKEVETLKGEPEKIKKARRSKMQWITQDMFGESA